MQQYRRMVSYLHKYVQEKKGENTGFVRIDTRREGIRLYIQIQDGRMMDERRLKVYLYSIGGEQALLDVNRGRQMQLIFVDEIRVRRGKCEYKKIVLPDLTDEDFERLSGILFYDRDELLYGSCWDDKGIYPIDSSGKGVCVKEKEMSTATVAVKEIPATGTMEEVISGKRMLGKKLTETRVPTEAGVSTGTGALIEAGALTKTGVPTETGALTEAEVPAGTEVEMEQEKDRAILSQFPRIEIESPDHTVFAVKIQMEDIAKLKSSDWKLADNEFLKHMYQGKEHLLLGKIELSKQERIWVLGIPGVYENREKYLAGIFGFTDYLPVKITEFKTGEAGYWIRKIKDPE